MLDHIIIMNSELVKNVLQTDPPIKLLEGKVKKLKHDETDRKKHKKELLIQLDQNGKTV